jgi:hypothetical protein
MIDVERAWRETSGGEHVIHLNHAGASLMPDPVLREPASGFGSPTGSLGRNSATAPQSRGHRRGE